MVPSVPRRLSDASTSAETELALKKPKSIPTPCPQPVGLRVILNADTTAPTQIGMMPPSYTFPSQIGATGVVVVDKSRFIKPLDALLDEYPGCIIALPPGTGKTALKSMLATYYDLSNPAPLKELFHPLQIFTTDPSAPRTSFAACFYVETGANAVQTSQYIDAYLCQTIRDFVVKYKDILGNILIFKSQETDPIVLIDIIRRRASSLERKLFIGIDHWDHPILASLASNNGTEIATHLTGFLDKLVIRNETKQVAKLLVFGNLPFDYDGELEAGLSLARIKNISLHPKLKGAFGMTATEVLRFYSVLSHNRRTNLVATTALFHTFGAFDPPRLYAGDERPGLTLNFNVVLHYAATTLGLTNDHANLPTSPKLSAIATLSRKLLEDSSIRRGYSMLLPPLSSAGQDLLFHTTAPLIEFSTKEDALWRLLFYLGALAVSKQQDTLPDPLWELKVCGTWAHTQIPSPQLQESPRDVQLRALFDRNPRPMAEAIARRLTLTRSQNLYDINEAVFQTMVDGYMDDEERTHVNNYFPQLALHTDPDQSAGPSTAGVGRGRNGFLDIFIRSIIHVRRGRVVAIELKYVSIEAILRARVSVLGEIHGGGWQGNSGGDGYQENVD
ncbi:hypothetical protein B0H15DRAFT_799666 [Mycena belliarum]|uniref:AAA-ATPase-like domain-containing protein n=1 Tax=Mycena belliarum TaxID=1033014 RepID=A0AAD6U7C2_9AGAR|nr:hypothetical protein B0H15DRAFT_799666 [Mycena belliae]